MDCQHVGAGLKQRDVRGDVEILIFCQTCVMPREGRRVPAWRPDGWICLGDPAAVEIRDESVVILHSQSHQVEHGRIEDFKLNPDVNRPINAVHGFHVQVDQRFVPCIALVPDPRAPSQQPIRIVVFRIRPVLHRFVWNQRHGICSFPHERPKFHVLRQPIRDILRLFRVVLIAVRHRCAVRHDQKKTVKGGRVVSTQPEVGMQIAQRIHVIVNLLARGEQDQKLMAMDRQDRKRPFL